MNNSTEKENQWKSILLIFIGILLVIVVVGASGYSARA
jgi:flagellar basal body-associated protein FliL